MVLMSTRTCISRGGGLWAIVRAEGVRAGTVDLNPLDDAGLESQVLAVPIQLHTVGIAHQWRERHDRAGRDRANDSAIDLGERDRVTGVLIVDWAVACTAELRI